MEWFLNPLKSELLTEDVRREAFFALAEDLLLLVIRKISTFGDDPEIRLIEEELSITKAKPCGERLIAVNDRCRMNQKLIRHIVI